MSLPGSVCEPAPMWPPRPRMPPVACGGDPQLEGPLDERFWSSSEMERRPAGSSGQFSGMISSEPVFSRPPETERRSRTITKNSFISESEVIFHRLKIEHLRQELGRTGTSPFTLLIPQPSTADIAYTEDLIKRPSPPRLTGPLPVRVAGGRQDV